jgi:hypothetical protein
MKTYDKSLIEVWDWKDKIYNETKGLSSEDYIKKLKIDADNILSNNQISLIPISFSDKQKNVA